MISKMFRSVWWLWLPHLDREVFHWQFFVQFQTNFWKDIMHSDSDPSFWPTCLMPAHSSSRNPSFSGRFLYVLRKWKSATCVGRGGGGEEHPICRWQTTVSVKKTEIETVCSIWLWLKFIEKYQWNSTQKSFVWKNGKTTMIVKYFRCLFRRRLMMWLDCICATRARPLDSFFRRMIFCKYFLFLYFLILWWWFEMSICICVTVDPPRAIPWIHSAASARRPRQTVWTWNSARRRSDRRNSASAADCGRRKKRDKHEK